MRRRRLDAETAARLLRGAVPPGDAPPGYAEAARLLQAAAGATAEIDVDRASTTVAAMAAAVTAPTIRRSTMRSKFTPKLAAAAAAGALSFAGVAAAMGGPLSPIHGLAAAFHGDGRVVADESTTSTTGDRNHGACVSQVAHDHDGFASSTGGGFASSTGHPDNHGAAVSEAAHSDCGKKPEGERGHSAEHRPGATTTTTSATPSTSTTEKPEHEDQAVEPGDDHGQSASHVPSGDQGHSPEHRQDGDHRQDGEHGGGSGHH